MFKELQALMLLAQQVPEAEREVFVAMRVIAMAMTLMSTGLPPKEGVGVRRAAAAIWRG